MAETIPAPLKGKVAVVTGGSRGIGAGIAQTFARNGCTHIAITYLANKNAAHQTLDAIREINSSIKTCAFSADVRDPESGKKVVEEALKQLGTDHIDIMVSNAAVVEMDAFPPAADLDHQSWSNILTAEAWTPFVLAREAVKYMPKGGRIILLSSTASKMALGDPMTIYAVGKAALDTVARNLATIYGPKYGVTVNSISVGATVTDGMKAAMDSFGPGSLEWAASLSLMKRVGEVEDVADIVAFVASPQAGWITGNAVPANGGTLSMLQS
ncbi:hypothetical protein LTR36_002690 [Oleoguttula mirabilis]|uniref:Uncharacterized protein n=1 Tax=Oleoguttula mirabilis TaxID=1507867 RepID=A0AAV9JKH0_9PEZI|nr:hypothetical protein LTR36_002690 [Oleoguttula mirabilis]